MQKNDKTFSPRVTFTEQTPKIQIGNKRIDPLYKKAFLSDSAESCAFNHNTSAWD